MAFGTVECSVFELNAITTPIGTIDTVIEAEIDWPYDELGVGRLTFPAADTAAAALATRNRFIWCYINSSVTGPLDMTAFAIESVRTVENGSGVPLIEVSGRTLDLELNFLSVGSTVFDDGADGPDTDDIDNILAFAPNSWGIGGATTGTTNGTYLIGNGESVFEMLIRAAEQSGEHFRLRRLTPAVRLIDWLSAPDVAQDSGGTDMELTTISSPTEQETNDHIGVIRSITKDETSQESVTRITAYGAGSGEDRLTMQGMTATPTPPTGYALNKANSLITNTALEATSQPVVHKHVQFSNVRAADDSAAAIETARQALYYTALNWLQDRGAAAERYTVTCYLQTDVSPYQTIDIDYVQTVGGSDIVDIQGTYTIHRVRHRLAGGIRETTLEISNSNRKRPTDGSEVVAFMRDVRAQTRHATAPASGSSPSTTDHGSLLGLSDDDHPQYLLANGTRLLTGNLSVSATVTIDGVDISAHAADADAHHNQVHSLSGGDHTGLLPWADLNKTGSNLADLETRTHGSLSGVTADQHHAQQHAIVGADHTAAGSAFDLIGLSATNTLGVLTPQSDPTGEAILKSDSNGRLELRRLGLNVAPTDTLHVSSGNILLEDGDILHNADLNVITSDDLTLQPATNLVLQPVGDVIFNPTGDDVLPNSNYDINLGAINKKYLTLHAAELWVETLVAQDTIATIGGRVLVGPTTVLEADLSNVATSISVKHNQMSSGDRVYMEANGKVEFMAVTSGPSGSGPYSYSVTRNLDGTGANEWYAGDAVFNTGQAGDGFIDLYSLQGVNSNGAGPTIAGNVRNSSTFNDWSEAWAIGNLNGLYGYGSDTYGVGLGKYAAGASHLTIDDTNGVRIRNNTADVVGQWAVNGDLTLGLVSTNSPNLFFDDSAGQLQFRSGAGGTAVFSYFDGVGGFYSLDDGSDSYTLLDSGDLRFYTEEGFSRGISWREEANSDFIGSITMLVNSSTDEPSMTIQANGYDSGASNQALLQLRVNPVGVQDRPYIDLFGDGTDEYVHLGIIDGGTGIPAVTLTIDADGLNLNTGDLVLADGDVELTSGALTVNNGDLSITASSSTDDPILIIENDSGVQTTITTKRSAASTDADGTVIINDGNNPIVLSSTGGIVIRSGGLVVGSPTGGEKGAGSINVAGDIYKNNAAYTNPDYALEHWATGRIVQHVSKRGAADYLGRLPLNRLRAHLESTYKLPGMSDAPLGAFGRFDWLLEKLEEAYTYIIDLHERIDALEEAI